MWLGCFERCILVLMRNGMHSFAASQFFQEGTWAQKAPIVSPVASVLANVIRLKRLSSSDSGVQRLFVASMNALRRYTCRVPKSSNQKDKVDSQVLSRLIRPLFTSRRAKFSRKTRSLTETTILMRCSQEHRLPLCVFTRYYS